MNRRASQKPLTKLARGRECQIRIPLVCCFDPETTVPCHYRMPGLSGAGYIPDAIHVAWGCFRCHQYVDSHNDDATQRAFAEGVLRTQAILLKEGKLEVMA